MRAWLFVLAACGSAPSARTAVVAEGDVVDRVVLTGALHPTAATDLVVPQTDASPLAIRWMVPDGTIVKAGDRVLELDDSQLVEPLKAGRSQLRSAEAQFKVAQHANTVALAGKRFDLQHQQLMRDRAKLRGDLPADLTNARTAATNKMTLAQAEADLDKAKQQLGTATEELAIREQLKRLDLEHTRRSIADLEHSIGSLVVTAPHDGVVVVSEQSDGHKYRIGDVVQQGLAILTQPDLAAPMNVRADLMDVDDGRVELHMGGTCTVDAYPDQPIPCAVTELGPVARPKLGHSSLRRSFDVTLALSGGDRARLLPAMSVKIVLERSRVHGLVVPRTAVHDGHVQLPSGERRDIGACDAQHCAIGGLAAGDLVVIGGV